jgi:hypothetical protein
MSAPENSNSKTPPSLLSDGKQAGGAQSARILANLEGRVTPPAAAPRRSKAPLATVIALVAAAAGGWGVWHWQQQADDRPAVVAAAAQPAVKAGAASGAVATTQVAQNATASALAASAPQPATIVNDDNAAKSAGASGASGADENRLSRALANGAVDEQGSAAAAKTDVAKADGAKAAAPKAAKGTTVAASGKAEAKADAAHAKADAARRRRIQQIELAQAKKHHGAAARQSGTSSDDPDADLLEALVARTRPADAKSRAAAVSVSATTGSAALAARVKECSARGFFEDQLCRWRVCDGHWGKDPACPASQQQAHQQQ